MPSNRVIGRYTGTKNGPLTIVIGGMHGNELAGVKALRLVFKMLEVEPITNPEFEFIGRLLGIKGNIKAIKAKRRFLKKDLNRQWTAHNIERISSIPINNLDAEDQELKGMLELIHKEIKRYKPSSVLIVDIHTTTAHGGVFAISNNDSLSLSVAKKIKVPVIIGLVEIMQGTSLHYFNSENFNKANLASISFEAGQHDDPLSVNRAIAFVINSLKCQGSIMPHQVENRHSDILKATVEGLPSVARLKYIHNVKPNDNFVMNPGYVNFQEVQIDEILATDKNGIIKAPYSGLILMPLYQKQGSDGFFLIEPIAQ